MTEVAPQRLEPLTLPLFGERLIEASAGTGKTFTIGALYLRLLLGLGGAILNLTLQYYRRKKI
jgi:exodeoxyribonuclease V beta subunit